MKVAFLTAGGLAPCLSASIGALIKSYHEQAPTATFLGYRHGYQGLLLGRTLPFPPDVHQWVEVLYSFGGSPLGNSRVKLTNAEDCLRRGLVPAGKNPLQVAAEQLGKDKVDILHPIGGDDTNTMAGELLAYLEDHDYNLTVVGLPKTVDNDIFPIVQTLGASTAAEQGARFFENIANENTTSNRQLLIHEVMGRHCGWLTAATARTYRNRLQNKTFYPALFLSWERWDIDAVYIPEMDLQLEQESERLKRRMDEKDCVTIFLSEGAGVETIVAQMELSGETVRRDAFGHVRLDEINPGEWYARQFTSRLQADKVLVQKSGYFARSAPPNSQDLELIQRSAALAVEQALGGQSGVVGLDEDREGQLSLIPFDRIRGGKPFAYEVSWFTDLLTEIGQPWN